MLRQSNAATSASVRLSSMTSFEQRKRACAVKATGPQSTQVRVVSLESPTPNPIPVEGAPAACRVSSKDYTVGKRSPLAAAALRLTIAQRTRELAKVRVAAAMTPGLSPGGQSKQPAAALATAVDPSCPQPNQAKSLVGPTYIQHPFVPVESAGQAGAQEPAVLVAAAAVGLQLLPGGLQQPAAALATAVDPSYPQPNQAKSLVGPTYIQHPFVPVESAGQAGAQEPAVLVAAAAVGLQLLPGGLQQPAAALATAVDTSYPQPNQAKSLVGPTYIQHPCVLVESAGQAGAQEHAALVADAADGLQLLPGGLQQPAAALAAAVESLLLPT